ncbi:MAG: hypothetical protein JSV04_12120, partial [Candidatus Heimdallarchaeota archaeon]
KLFFGSAGRKKRSELAFRVQELALESEVIEITAEEIDQTLNKRPTDNLNYLELRYIAEMLTKLTSNEIIVDTLSKPQYSHKYLTKHLKQLNSQLLIKTESCGSENCHFHVRLADITSKRIIISKKADQKFPVVSAASCLAKYMRDQHLRDIEEEWDFPLFSLGSGYPNENDPQVISFLQTHRNEIQNHDFPFIRYSWSWPPLQQIIGSTPKPLDEYFNK